VDVADRWTTRSALVRAAVVLGAAALILAVMLGLGWVITRAVPGSGLGGFDLGIDVWLAEHRTPALDAASTVATDVCSTTSVFVLGFLAAAGSAALLRRWWPAVLFPVALVGELWLFLATAMIVKRPRPPVAHVDAALPPTSSFPSGHTGAAICLFGGIAAVVVCTVRAWWRWLVVATAAVLVIAVALARMYRGAHYLTDALGAVVLAVPWLLVTLWAVHLAAPPGGRRPSPARHGHGATPPPLTTR
jgi:membrane-associated phospholipid phosphatase